MDAAVLGRTASRLRRVSWDEPYRWLASLIALAGVFGAREGERALGELAQWAESLGAVTVGRAILDVDAWLSENLGGEVATGVMALIAALATATIVGSGAALAVNRSASTLLLVWFTATYTEGGATTVGVTAVVVAAGAVAWRKFFADYRSTGPLEWCALAAGSLAVALFHVLLAVGARLVGSNHVPTPRPEMPLPTGAVR